jgi:hypothetical protein
MVATSAVTKSCWKSRTRARLDAKRLSAILHLTYSAGRRPPRGIMLWQRQKRSGYSLWRHPHNLKFCGPLIVADASKAKALASASRAAKVGTVPAMGSLDKAVPIFQQLCHLETICS